MLKASCMLLFGIIVFLSSTNLFSQTGSVSGFVYDDSDGEALIGANVYIPEISYGSSTNISGYFVIPDTPAGTYTIICSYVGYEKQEVTMDVTGGSNEITFRLQPDLVETGEVIVTSDSGRTIDKMFNKQISKLNLSQGEINRIPRIVEADLLRALQTMPGITAVSDFSSALYVRGGTPDQNLYLIDGTDVYNPEHAFGIFSTFNTYAIKKVEMSKGGFSAEYGGRLSSVLDVTNLDGNRNEFEGVANVSLLSASTTLQMPIGNIGSVSGSFRRTYIDQTYAKWMDDIPDYYFYDGNVKAFFDFDRSNKLTVSLFKGKDDLDFQLDPDAPESYSFNYDWGNTTASINWKHIFSPKLFASFWATGSIFDSEFTFEAVDLTENNFLSDYSFKGALEYYASQNVHLNFGMEQKLLHEKYDQSMAGTGRIFIENDRQLTTAYLDLNWEPSVRWSFDIGVRGNMFNADTTYWNFEPRFSAKYRLTDESNLKLAASVHYQYIHRIPRLFFSSIWATASKYQQESAAQHVILGYQRTFSEIFEFEIETYYKRYKNLFQYNWNVGTDIDPTYYDPDGRPVYGTTEGVFNRGDGNSYGVEVLLRKNVGFLTGWLAYSYSVTEYEFDGINQEQGYPPRHDRTSVVNGVLNFDLNQLFGNPERIMKPGSSRWLVSLNFIYTTGQPLTIPGSAYYVNTAPDWDGIPRDPENDPAYTLYPGTINDFRLPDYIRMDLSITYKKQYDGWTLEPYLQIFNLGNRQNVWFINYKTEVEGDVVKQTVEEVNMLPLLPSLGVTIMF